MPALKGIVIHEEDMLRALSGVSGTKYRSRPQTHHYDKNTTFNIHSPTRQAYPPPD